MPACAARENVCRSLKWMLHSAGYSLSTACQKSPPARSSAVRRRRNKMKSSHFQGHVPGKWHLSRNFGRQFPKKSSLKFRAAYSKKWLVNFYQLTSHFFDSLRAAPSGRPVILSDTPFRFIVLVCHSICSSWKTYRVHPANGYNGDTDSKNRTGELWLQLSGQQGMR